MFTKPKKIETAFQYVRLLSIIAISAAFIFCSYVVYNCNEKLSIAQNRIYILSSGKVLEALAGDRKDNVPVEARDHIKNFHQLFFSLDPDDKVINTNLSKALYLADESAKKLYDNLKETGYYQGIISGNISQQIVVDSILLNMTSYPFYFRCYATEKIIRTTSIVTRDLITEGLLRNVARSDNNPHGFLIERFNTLENKDQKVEVR